MLINRKGTTAKNLMQKYLNSQTQGGFFLVPVPVANLSYCCFNLNRGYGSLK